MSKILLVDEASSILQWLDYLTKALDIDSIRLVVTRAPAARSARLAHRRLVIETALGHRMIADSPPMRRLLVDLEHVAPKDVTVLVYGETGTGKELVATLLHIGSPRAKKPFVRFHCGAISPSNV